MSAHKSSNTLAISLILIFLAISVFAAGYWYGRNRLVPPFAVNKTIFQRTIDDAKNVSVENISDELWAINAGSPNVVWQDTEGESRIKVAAWMNEAAYTAYYEPHLRSGEDVIGPPSPTIWVTLVPQVREFCRQLVSTIDENIRTRFDPSFRLKQYMGLNPQYRYERFVEMWVDPSDVFRPCPDPQIDDHSCSVSMDESNVPTVKGIDDYQKFFTGLSETQYQPGPFAAPWTQLGYTYDWVRGVRNVGASEFMLAPHARYQVDASYSTAEYCGLQ